MDELIAKRDDVLHKVQLEEQEGKIQTNQVQDWLKNVEDTKTVVDELLLKHDNISSNGSTCLGKCRCLSSYKLGKRSTKLLTDIEKLISREENLEIAIPRFCPAPTTETQGLVEMQMGSHNLVGTFDSNVEKVLTWLKDDNVGIIGLYGMGGVGKTTLLKKINNELPKSGIDAFECALWVVASTNATIQTIQQNIISKLGMPLNNNSEDEICTEIYRTLKNKKYILMLDDVWEMIDLFEGVGIPKPDNENISKIVITTRLKDVCFQMGAHLITEVQCLSWEDAWSLFQEKVGKATLGPHIESYARKVTEECNGLPLALITIGRAMSGKVEPCEWSYALDQLRNYPAKILDLGKKVFPKLQLSYDYLADATKQKCFLYCSLFPEDWEIDTKELVNLWMGEGYLNEIQDIKKAYDYGYSIIEDLKRACLLESGSSICFEQVKMHDVIRDMALWIAKKEFLVLDKAETMRAKSNNQDWNGDVEKMSFWRLVNYSYMVEDGISSKGYQDMFLLTRECPNLSTLLDDVYQKVSLSGLINNFIPNVRVLSLSGNCALPI